MYGFDPLIHAARDEPREEKVPAAAERARELREVSETLKERWRAATNQRSVYYEGSHKRKEYRVGDIVLLSTKNLKLRVPKKKLGPKFVGPFRVVNAVGT